MSDLRTRLEEHLRNRYVIERELGGGGMSRVFLAHETALDRRVVIKVLLPELAAGLSSQRFAREIRLAASLQQANIVPVLAAGETDGLPHYTMPFVEGLSLRESLERSGRLPLDRIVGILRDVARALAYAHERGVVHRDIKPENVLLSGDAAVVTDFGIAKAISAARGTGAAPAPATVTVAGTAVGTPAYMAPEQIAAEPDIDHRADLYSFGCLAYELLTGAPPFGSSSLQSLFAAHLSQAPAPVGERSPDCPPRLARVVMQCLQKEPGARPESARAVLTAFDSAEAPAGRFTRIWRRASARQRWGVLAAGTILVAGAGAVVARNALTGAPDALSAVAVVPFLNLSGDPAEEYLADGLADGLATALGKLPGLRVVSRALSYRYKGERAMDARKVGRELSADLLLHGALRSLGGRLRVSAQLTSASDNREVWSESYDEGSGDALAVQDSITRAIVAAIQEQFGGVMRGVPASAVRIETADPEAYDLYMRARFLLQRRGGGVRQAVENFERAIARDSSFARAHAGLALALELLPYFEPVAEAGVRNRAMAAANRALRSDSTLAEAHTALAMAHQHAYQWSAAEAEYRKALAIESGEADAHLQYGRFLFYNGRLSQARAEFERARELDPYSAVASGWVGHLKGLGGSPAEELAEIRRALEIDSTSPPVLVFAADALGRAGQLGEARGLAERLWRSVPPWRAAAAGVLASLGAPERAREMIAALETAPPGPLANARLAYLHLALRDTARALDAFERATDAGEIWPTYYSLSERMFDPLRESPRFAAVVRRVGLDPRIFTAPGGGRQR